MTTIVVVVVAAVFIGACWWLQWRMITIVRRRDQFVTLSAKRYAELLDVERRQREEG